MNLGDMRMKVHLGDGVRRAEEEVLLLMGLGQVLLPGGSPHIHLQIPKGAKIHIVCTAYLNI